MTVLTGADGCIYRDVPGWPGYALSDAGFLWSCKNRRGDLTELWHPIRATEDHETGYCRVGLHNLGKHRTVCLNVLMLEVFVGPAPYKHEACHKDGNPRNNTIKNLYWGTRKQNAQDSVRHGTMPRGSKHGMAKLVERDIPVIRRLGALLVPKRVIADAFLVDQAVITGILNGTAWTHVTEEQNDEE